MCKLEVAIFNIQRTITLKVGKQESRFICSACHLIVFNICAKFHEIMSRGFKVMEQTQKLLTDTHTSLTHTHRKDENYIPHCTAYILMPGCITRVRFMCSACRLMVYHLCEVS